MKPDTIVQFVCFVTNLDAIEFVPKWKHFAKKWIVDEFKPELREKLAKTTTKFRYISQHECEENNFYFNFMKERNSEYFPEHKVKVINAGGYLSLEFNKEYFQKETEVRIVACINISHSTLDHYRELPLYIHLNVYKAYYESCLYSHIIEFVVLAIHAEELEQLLKGLPNTETGIYKNSLVA